MKTNTEDFDKLISFMPEGWEEKAIELGAITRSRKIKSASELLRLNLLYLTSGGSFGKTSAMLKLTEDNGLNKNAVYERVKKSHLWLHWLAQQLCRSKGYLYATPDWLKEYRVCLVDATDEAKKGSLTADYRLHYCVDLFSLHMVEMHLTETKTGETITNFKKLQNGDIIVADRAYSSIKAIDYLKLRQSDFVLRYRANTFTVYYENGERLQLPQLLSELAENECRSIQLFYKKGKQLSPIRICATRKSSDAERKGLNKLKSSNNKKMRGKVSELQEIYNRYVIVITSLPEEITAQQIMELYRSRWQVELVFKRLKSIFDYDEMPSVSSEAIESWFYGKLLLSALCEAVVNEGRFSP